MVIYLQE